jgi:hypothetical protein
MVFVRFIGSDAVQPDDSLVQSLHHSDRPRLEGAALGTETQCIDRAVYSLVRLGSLDSSFTRLRRLVASNYRTLIETNQPTTGPSWY